MDHLPDWAESIIAVAVGLSPGLALQLARPIGRFLRRTMLETPEAAPQSGLEPVRCSSVRVKRKRPEPLLQDVLHRRCRGI
jgi:hypothetical protein